MSIRDRNAAARVAREQGKLRKKRAAAAPAMSVKVTIERRQGTITTSTISGTGPDLAAALWNARSRASNMASTITDLLDGLLPGELEQ
jgi:hypothetical protein